MFDTPLLIQSLAHYSEQLPDTKRKEGPPLNLEASPVAQSLLLLRVQAAASYYSTNRTLMDFPQPVDADISMLQLRKLFAPTNPAST